MKNLFTLLLLAFPLLLLSQNLENKTKVEFYAGPAANRVHPLKEWKSFVGKRVFQNPIHPGMLIGIQTDVPVWKGLVYNGFIEMETIHLEASYINSMSVFGSTYKHSFTSNTTALSLAPLGLGYKIPLVSSIHLMLRVQGGMLFSLQYEVAGRYGEVPYIDQYITNSRASEKRKEFVSASTGVGFNLNQRPVGIMIGYRSFGGSSGELLWDLGASGIEYRRELAWIALGFTL